MTSKGLFNGHPFRGAELVVRIKMPNQMVFMFFSRFFVEYVENGEMIDDGLLKGLGDTGAGVLALILLGEPSWGAGAGTKNKGTQRRY